MPYFAAARREIVSLCTCTTTSSLFSLLNYTPLDLFTGPCTTMISTSASLETFVPHPRARAAGRSGHVLVISSVTSTPGMPSPGIEALRQWQPGFCEYNAELAELLPSSDPPNPGKPPVCLISFFFFLGHLHRFTAYSSIYLLGPPFLRVRENVLLRIFNFGMHPEILTARARASPGTEFAHAPLVTA